jgi:hypothetical protein
MLPGELGSVNVDMVGVGRVIFKVGGAGIGQL